MKIDAPGQLNLLDPSVGLPERGILGITQRPIAAWEEIEMRRLLDRLCAGASRRLTRADFIAEFSFTQIHQVAKEARSFVHLLDPDSRPGFSSCAALGLALRKHVGRIVVLSNGARAVMSYIGNRGRRHKDEMYRIACGRDVDADTPSDRTHVLTLVAYLVKLARRREHACDHKRETHDFRKNEIRRAAIECGAFPWLDLDTLSGQARLGLSLAAFDAEKATDGRDLVTLRATNDPGRQRRWRLRFVYRAR